MTIGEFRTFIPKALGHRRRVLVKGKPGVGKTFSFAAACRQLKWDFIPICAPLQSPVKVGGYPRPPEKEGGDATHALFDGIAKAMRATEPTLVLFDDLGMAGGETLKAIVDFVQFGRIDSRTLPDCVTIAGATNDIGHGADVQGLIEPLKTRWHTIIEVETSIDDIVPYGLTQNWPTDLLAFLRNSPDSLHSWVPEKSIKVNGACPRGWEYVAEWVNIGIDDPEVIGGCVGQGEAAKYLAFRKLANNLPDIDQILLDPAGTPVPNEEEPSASYLVTCALSSRMDGNTFGKCVTYLNRMGAIFRGFCIKDAFKAEVARKQEGKLPANYKPISTSRDFVAWSSTKDGHDLLAAAS